MDINEKIGRVRDLIAQRDQVDAELEGLLGGAPPASAPRKDTIAKAKMRKAGRFGTKACCGSTGSRHFKTCSQSGSRDVQNLTPAREAPKTEALGPDRYEAIRTAMHDRDFSSVQYALTNRYSPREVNAVIKSVDYDDYLMNR